MHIQYRRTFSQFVDSYLTSYYTLGGQTLQRLLGGPALILGGVLFILLAATKAWNLGIRLIADVAGGLAILYGLGLALRPLGEILLVWLRRDEFLGEEGAIVTIEFADDQIRLDDPDGSFTFPLARITSIQHRTDSTWIMVAPDHLIYLPREELLSGNHDEFLAALEGRLRENEEPKPSALLWD